MQALIVLQMWLLRITLALMILGIVRSRHALVEWLRSIPRPVLAALAALVVAGTLARFYGSMWNIEYSNAHSYHRFLPFGVRGDTMTAQYGLGVPVLWDAVFTAFHPSLDVVFSLDFILGSLTPALVFFAARGIYEDDGAALLAAALLAFSPTHIRSSATDNYFIPQLFFWAFGFASLAFATSHERARPAFVSAAAALCFGAQCRPFGVLAALPAVLFLQFRGGGLRAWWRDPDFQMALKLTAVIFPVHVFLMVWVTLADGIRIAFQGSQSHLARFMSPYSNVLLDPTVTPWVLLALAAAGVVALSGPAHRRVLAIVLPPLLLTAWFNGPLAQDLDARLRYHLEPLFWTTILAGGSVLLVARLPQRCAALRWWVVAALLLLAASGLYSNRRLLSLRFDSHREYDFLRRVAPGLPGDATIVTLDPYLIGSSVNTALPRPWFEHLGKRWEYLPASAWLRGTRGRSQAIWYRGITCWMFDPPDPKPTRAAGAPGAPDPRMRPECRDIERAFVLEPLAETRFDAHPDRMVDVAPQLVIGFYRLRPRDAPLMR